MKKFLHKLVKAENIIDVFKHLLFMVLFLIGFLLTFFYVFLPWITNHGESVTVPDITGLRYESLDEFLTERDLRFEVNSDSGYSTEYPPLAVLKQYPESGEKVKENRKIYLTLNATNPPNVKMPRLIDGSLKNAEIVLESYGLLMGNILYKPDPARNAVLEQMFNGKPIPEGALVSKGSRIDLIVGDGYGNQVFIMPDVVGMELDEARVLLLGSGLIPDEVIYVEAPDEKPGFVLSQIPVAETSVNIGSKVDLWVTEIPSGEEPE